MKTEEVNKLLKEAEDILRNTQQSQSDTIKQIAIHKKNIEILNQLSILITTGQKNANS